MKQFEIKMRCVVTKIVTVECETEDEARDNPWDHAVDEMEIGQDDWNILSVREIE